MEAMIPGKQYRSVIEMTYDIADDKQFAFELEQQIRDRDRQKGFRQGVFIGIAVGSVGSLVIYLSSLLLR